MGRFSAKRKAVPADGPRGRIKQPDMSWYLISILKQVKPSAISTSQLNTLLHLHLTPIKQVVYLRPYPTGEPVDGRSYLGVGFSLRCFQRLSLPDVATQRRSWRNDWHTRGLSLSVLSY